MKENKLSIKEVTTLVVASIDAILSRLRSTKISRKTRLPFSYIIAHYLKVLLSIILLIVKCERE